MISRVIFKDDHRGLEFEVGTFKKTFSIGEKVPPESINYHPLTNHANHSSGAYQKSSVERSEKPPFLEVWGKERVMRAGDEGKEELIYIREPYFFVAFIMEEESEQGGGRLETIVATETLLWKDVPQPREKVATIPLASPLRKRVRLAALRGMK